MSLFASAHATHPDWRMALSMAHAQLRAQWGAEAPPALGLVYFSDRHAPQAAALLKALQQQWPGTQWVGGVAVGILAGGVEYFDEPALALMLMRLPADSVSVFSGARPLAPGRAYTALVHADPSAPEVAGLIGDLAERTTSGYLFGGLVSTRLQPVQVAGSIVQGGLSGVAFGADVAVVSRVTQGCQPIGPSRRITEADRNLVLALDDQPALPRLMADLGLDEAEPREAIAQLRMTLVGLTDAADDMLTRGRQFGADVRVRHLVGVDHGRQAVAVADLVEPGMQLAFCRRDAAAARRDLVRICTEIRDEVEADAWERVDAAGQPLPPGRGHRHIAGAVYVSCAGRGGPHFGAPSAEAQIVRHALGDVPLVGFFAGGEIARRHLYGYTGVLTAFLQPDC